MKITPVILCGGSGTRLWPLSRQYYPKQFLKLAGDETLFQQSISRLIGLATKHLQIEEILIITNESHRFIVLEQIKFMNLTVPIRILLEPKPRNTAPALTLAALASHNKNTESVLVVTPADHYIKDHKKFKLTVQEAIKVVEKNTIVTIGIKPTRPETGFGYIHFKGNSLVKNVIAFREKPSITNAEKMIKQGNHAWNSGIFILHSNTWLASIHKANSFISEAISHAWQKKIIDQKFERPDKDSFNKSPTDSIDYSVMEKFRELEINVKLILLNTTWSDLGSFDSLDNLEIKDNDGNIFKGDVVSINTKNTIAMTEKNNISLLGVKNLIVIQTSDNVLVANKDDAQSIKELVKVLKKNHQYLLKEHTRVNRPWGWFELIDVGHNYKVKKIHVNPGASLSYQSHRYRNEHWVSVKGKATVIRDDIKFFLKHNESTFIKKNVKHQLMNSTKDSLEIIEVQTGNKLIEEDIIRFHDSYGRSTSDT